ncbi:MAG: ANTAR domain-containing protein [Pirellulales bacterium]
MEIAVADKDPATRQFLVASLTRLGHRAKAVPDGASLLALCDRRAMDLIITEIDASLADGLVAAERLCKQRPTPIIVATTERTPEALARAREGYVFGYLIKPIVEAELAPAVEIAISRFEEFQALRKETEDLRRALADRKIIERAKGVLMQQSGLPEAAAFQQLQKLARSKSKKLVEIADSILTANEAMTPGH